jgi:tRNA (guanine37-N1)-methyltransferase
MEFHVLTIFPGIFEGPLRWGLLARAGERGLVRVAVHDVRDHAVGPHRSTDDYPYGGGGGMVMRPEPLFAAVEAARAHGAQGPAILMTPQGEVFTHRVARELAALSGMILICGRYEGVDERVREGLADREISIGDYVLMGGETAALVVMEAVARLVPGVLGNDGSAASDSFEGGVLGDGGPGGPAVGRPWGDRVLAAAGGLEADDGEAARSSGARHPLRPGPQRPGGAAGPRGPPAGQGRAWRVMTVGGCGGGRDAGHRDGNGPSLRGLGSPPGI